ncbi:MAG: DUF2007 domain-containing protein [Phycisphaerae bacterium]|nr:DUF2007 domain-containing protein [Phycisphaerae bacterium]MDD5380340.1 DUF2007 domain-containing protein [Phycisphaerae bacterium]
MAKRSQSSSTPSTNSGRTGSPSRAKSRERRKSPRSFGSQNKAAAPELIVVTFAEDMEQAKEYESLLSANGIPAMIKGQSGESADTDGIAVMVPEDYLDEAHVVIESQDAYDDFYDFALEDEDEEDEGDFDSELFEDDF